MVEVGEDGSQSHGGLVDVFGGAVDIPIFHRFALGQQGTLLQQLFHRGQLSFNGAVVDHIIGIFGGGVEFLHLKAHGRGGGVILVAQVIKEVGAAGNADHLSQIIGRLADIYLTTGGNVEKCHCLSRGRGGGLGKRLLLGSPGRLGLLLAAGQQAIEFYPLRASQGLCLIAGVVYQYRYAELLQPLLHLWRMVDHGALDSQAAVCCHDLFIVGFGVLTCIADLPRLHGPLGDVQIPAVR